MSCPCQQKTAMGATVAPPFQIPLNPVVGAVVGLVVGAAFERDPIRYLMGGFALGVAAYVFNTWNFARYTAEAVAAGNIVAGS